MADLKLIERIRYLGIIPNRSDQYLGEDQELPDDHACECLIEGDECLCLEEFIETMTTGCTWRQNFNKQTYYIRRLEPLLNSRQIYEIYAIFDHMYDLKLDGLFDEAEEIRAQFVREINQELKSLKLDYSEKYLKENHPYSKWDGKIRNTIYYYFCLTDQSFKDGTLTRAIVNERIELNRVYKEEKEKKRIQNSVDKVFNDMNFWCSHGNKRLQAA